MSMLAVTASWRRPSCRQKETEQASQALPRYLAVGSEMERLSVRRGLVMIPGIHRAGEARGTGKRSARNEQVKAVPVPGSHASGGVQAPVGSSHLHDLRTLLKCPIMPAARAQDRPADVDSICV